MSPSEVNKTNQAQLWKYQYRRKAPISKVGKSRKTYKFKLGDTVRISYLKYQFQRAYDQQWTDEIFRVSKRFRRDDGQMFAIVQVAHKVLTGEIPISASYKKKLRRYKRVLHSEDSRAYFPQNTVAAFRVVLDTRLDFKGQWYVGLCEVHCTNVTSSGEIYICTNICGETLLAGKKEQLLRRIVVEKDKDISTVFTAPFYLPLTTSTWQDIEIYIKDKQGHLSTLIGELYVPDTNKWIKFFRKLNSGKVDSYQYGRGQKGSGIGNFSRGTYMIPIDHHVKDDDNKKTTLQPVVKMVSPVAANLEQAKSYLKQEQQLFSRMPIKRRSRSSSVSPQKKAKRSTSKRVSATKKKNNKGSKTKRANDIFDE
ncbi:hypothetical protein KUTeg_011512 [Tegillarca granosa]|uniref:Uncharacterized protein n=1 Tax=Tegillarca granosa TaxID=220873 RepID=A0ABQ9F5W0_TEGGR|nr:hypothetical protein KUTeg_011512 [Tegillarca granosa]